ncbi:MAG: caspase family protein [Kiritimatiellales bacterium]
MTIPKTLSFLLATFLTLAAGLTSPLYAAGDKWALLIGVDKCEAVGELKVCSADAIALKSVLEQIGYPDNHITVLVDNNQSNINALPTIGNVERAIKRLAQVAEADDKILFFFSGHGVTYNGTSFLVPTDGDLTKGVSLTWVKDQFAACKAKEKVMILDACHSGAAKGVSGITPDLKTAANLVMLLSCEKEQVSWPDKQGRHSVFTSAILEGLSGKAANADRKVTHKTLADYVRKSVKDWTYENQKNEQTPVMVADASGDIVLADIALMKPANVTINVMAPPTPPLATASIPLATVASGEDKHAYYTGSSLESRSCQDASLFRANPGRFSVKAENQVADALLGKIWVLYDADEILTLSDARSRAEQLGARLPTQKELASLLALKQQKGDWARINGSIFPKHNRTSLFWTGSGTTTSIAALRQVVDFSDGSLRKASSDDQYGLLLILDK